MKLVIIEPLGVAQEKLLNLATSTLVTDLEIVYYDTRTTDSAELISRGKDADIIAVSNLPLNQEVIEGFSNLKMLAKPKMSLYVTALATPMLLLQI